MNISFTSAGQSLDTLGDIFDKTIINILKGKVEKALTPLQEEIDATGGVTVDFTKDYTCTVYFNDGENQH